jgi:hypothetical protein
MHRLSIIDNETQYIFDWNGSHTVEISYLQGLPFDVFSFGFDLSLGPTFVDFCCAVADWIGDRDE